VQGETNDNKFKEPSNFEKITLLGSKKASVTHIQAFDSAAVLSRDSVLAVTGQNVSVKYWSFIPAIPI